MGIQVFNHHGFVIPTRWLVKIVKYGLDIVDHGGANTYDGDLMNYDKE